MKFSDAAISKITVGQTMTTDDGSSLSQSQTHYKVRSALIEADAQMVNESFNSGPAIWITAYNFPGAAAPRVVRRPDEALSSLDQSEIAKRVADMAGTMDREWLEETFGVKLRAEPAPTAPPPGPATQMNFADLGDDADAVIKQIVSTVEGVANLEGVEKKLLQKIVKIADDDPDIIMGRLSELYSAMDETALADALTKIIFAASLWGEASARTS